MEYANHTRGERERGEEEHRFIVYFLDDYEDQSVHVEEVEEVDFHNILLHLNLGFSVFIARRKEPKPNINCPSKPENLYQ